MLGFLVGAIVGGIASYYWREKIHDYASTGVPDLRKRAADSLGRVGQRASDALDRARSGVDAVVRTGQERLRPTGTKAGREPQESSAGTGSSPAGNTITRH
jgi:hypothetical protein